MTLKCGIIGLPNVGKSTLFNALTESQQAESANYPFCTIEPNIGRVFVPDKRLNKLAQNYRSTKVIPAFIEFIDIAGLVRGANKGEGLGNRFLSYIREVDAIIHVIRCFEDINITHVHGVVNPIEDISVVDTELIIADLESVERKIANLKKKVNSDRFLTSKINLLYKCRKCLMMGQPIRKLRGIVNKELKDLQLLTSKPVLYVCNVPDVNALRGNRYSDAVSIILKQQGTNSIIISSQIEAEISTLGNISEKKEFLQSLHLEETGLNKIIRSAYSLLNLNSFFTVCPKETHAWTFTTGIVASQAAGIIHTDFKKGFIRAEVISYDEFIKFGTEVKVKEFGKMRIEGKNYVMQDGDIVYFRYNV